MSMAKRLMIPHLFPKWKLRPSKHKHLIRSVAISTGNRPLPIIETNKQNTGVYITVPGYGFDDVDRYGQVSPHKVARMTEAARTFLYKPRQAGVNVDHLHDYKMVGDIFYDAKILMKTAFYQFKPAFYNKEHLYHRLRVEEKIINVGKSSFQHYNEALSERTGEILHTNVIQVVVVDKEMRRARPLPNYLTSYLGDRVQQIPTERVDLLEKPTSTFVSQYFVTWSDTDLYLHTNHSRYIRICLDAMVDASLAGIFTQMKGDIAKYQLKTIKCYYQKQTVPKQKLDIHVWENVDDPFLVHGLVEREGQSAFQCSIQFVTPSKKQSTNL